jgi:hypothetical protein
MHEIQRPLIGIDTENVILHWEKGFNVNIWVNICSNLT